MPTTSPGAPPLPEPGQLVEVRRRPFVVTAVRPSALPASPHPSSHGHGHGHGPGPSESPRRQHLVSLTSVDDDGLGEELEVLWELEPGARVHERAALPDPIRGFDPPQRLDAFLDAVRWGAVASADLRALHAPFRSGITIEDYQLDPVVRALSMPRTSLLIVGLGKTIEAGLVVQELLLRHRARTVLIVCPASIQIQWRDQMRDKFGLEFRIVDSDLLRVLRRRRGLHTNPWAHFPRLITSIDFLKRERPLGLLRELLPPEGQPAFPRRFDLLIVDEAHNTAPAGPTTGSRYALDSQRTHTIRLLAPHFEHKLFLTATPHNGYPESFQALLELLDAQRFHRGIRPDPRQLAAVLVRRMKSEMTHPDGSPRFPARRLTAIEVAWSDEDREAHRALTEYTRLRQAGARDDIERFATEFVLKLLKKRLFSSPAAFASTLARHERSLTEARRQSRARRPDTLRPTAGLLRRIALGVLEDDGEDWADAAPGDGGDGDNESGAESLLDEAFEATGRVFRELAPDEEALLAKMRRYAERASGAPDTKARALLDWLTQHLRKETPSGVAWTDERVILFTEYRATQKWLLQILAQMGFCEEGRVLTLYGGMDSAEREAVKAAFQAAPAVSPVRILIATDAASEGIDLQNHCARLIHYEIPWNPNRMEQRNGRIDRHGQRAGEVLIHHFVSAGWSEERYPGEHGGRAGDLEGDLEFLFRAAQKVDQIREDLGKVGPVIAEQIEDAMSLSGRRTRLDPEQDSRTGRATAEARAVLRIERKLREDLDRLHARLLESRDALHISPATIQSVVETGLALAGQPPLIPTAEPGVFHLPALRGSWARCTEGLAHPHTHEIRPLTFDHGRAEGRDDVVLGHLNHRLVQMCLGLLRAEVWSQGHSELRRVTARCLPPGTLPAPALVAHARLVMFGADSTRLHEELVVAGGLLRDGRFARLGQTELRAALTAAAEGVPLPSPAAAPAPAVRLEDEPAIAIATRLAQDFTRHREPLLQALEARMRERTGALERLLAERAEHEVATLRTILEELDRNIRAQLEEAAPVQLALFSEPEREQLERNRDALRARLDAIPAEIERETAALRARYEDPSARLFPVALTYLVPAAAEEQA
jgi:superfamily II DNA or RNA helicase